MISKTTVLLSLSPQCIVSKTTVSCGPYYSICVTVLLSLLQSEHSSLASWLCGGVTNIDYLSVVLQLAIDS